MIKHFTVLSFLLFLSLNFTYSQTRQAIPAETSQRRSVPKAKSSADPPVQFRMAQDTVAPEIFGDTCSLSLFNFSIDGEWGLIGGTNGFFDLEKAQKLRYDPVQGFFVREIWGWFSTAAVVGDGDLLAKVYSLDESGQGPGLLTAISQPLKTSELIVGGDEALPTVFSIQNPLTIQDTAFFASIDFSQLYPVGDTAALWQTRDGCGDGDDSWELFSDGETWVPISNGEFSWGLNSNFLIAAVVEPTDLLQDRLEAPVFAEECGGSVTIYFSDQWGYVSGTNNYQDQEKAQKLTYEADADLSVREIWGWFGEVQTVNDGPVSAKVYAVDAASDSPGELLGVSTSRKTSELTFSDDQVLPTPFVFNEPVSVSAPSFFASIDISELYATTDTVALWQTEFDCGDGSTSWDLFSDGETWIPVINSEFSWGRNFNFLISAIIEFATDTDDQLAFVSQNGLQLFPAFPNPATETVHFRYQLDEPQRVHIEVYSPDGRLLQKRDLGRQAFGEHTEAIDVSRLSAGAYVYGIVTEKSRLMSRFVVSR